MKTYSCETAQLELYKILELITESHEPVQIFEKNMSGVLLSTEDWSAIQETLYLNSIPGMTESIIAASKEPRENMTKSEEIDW